MLKGRQLDEALASLDFGKEEQVTEESLRFVSSASLSRII